MLMQAVNTYLAIRRAADFKLDAVERYLRDFAQFAPAQGDTHVVTQTAIAWAAQATSEPQRHNRLNVVVRFARFSHAEQTASKSYLQQWGVKATVLDCLTPYISIPRFLSIRVSFCCCAAWLLSKLLYSG